MICRKCYARLPPRAVNSQEEVRTHQPAPPQEEAQISASLLSASGEFWGRWNEMRRVHATDMRA
ncbi:hypothetical protein BDU57DRAFT_343234 [Ampelomyces quisqualis]|uniref:Large ribosomal subunit protein eL40 domain-containing protein n=1 Tax=Ampelomyces quisqualis TaxID=50730 RepID=A0A6A5QEW0_AMPQU|nr:hypothetical protein BDU57DRAFT_343234 [Ampelomyces quisqualis]